MMNNKLNIIIFGASGNLSLKKLCPALFRLYCRNMLPENFLIWGYGRTDLNNESFRELILKNLTCSYTPDVTECARLIAGFLRRLRYFKGGYSNVNNMMDFWKEIKETNMIDADMLFYFAVPPDVIPEIITGLSGVDFVEYFTASTENRWIRVIIEKPFGRNLHTSKEIARMVNAIFPPEQVYRMDHYLGKYLVQNLLAIRFANSIFEYLWNTNYIERIEVIWKENLDTEGRGRYFDSYGIIRDVVQNHLMEVLAFVCMDEPCDFGDLRSKRGKFFKSIKPLRPGDVIVGQYVSSDSHCAYIDEVGVAKDSVTPTFFACRLESISERWKNTPFYIAAGKGMDERCNYINIQFKLRKHSGFFGEIIPDTFIVNIQPEENIKIDISVRKNELDWKMERKSFILYFKDNLTTILPEAYEQLIFDVIIGKQELFISDEEIEASWTIFDEILKLSDKGELHLLKYKFGSEGPNWRKILMI